MNGIERVEKLHEIEDFLKEFLGSDQKYDGLSASYFVPNCFANENQGIHCIYDGSDPSVIEDLLGFLDIPAMMNGFSLESVKSKANGSFHVFVYDDEKFHIDNIRNLRIMNTEQIFSKYR